MVSKFDKKDLIALFVSISFALIFINLSVYRYYNFHFIDWDLAFFSQAMWNLLHGKQFVSLFGINFFSNHSNLIAFLVLPFYRVWPHPLLLVFLKIFSFAGGALLFYHIAKKSIGFFPALALMCLYLFYIPNLFGLIYEFHFESLAPFFLFLLYYAFTENKKVLFFLTAVVLMLIKENMPLIIIAFGIYAFFSKKKDRIFWSALPITSGILIFYFLTTIFIPSFSHAKVHHYLGNYEYLGAASVSGLISAVLTNPMKVFNVTNITLLLNLLFPLMFLPLFGLNILFLVSPILLQHLFSVAWQEKTLIFHYWLTVSPFLFLATMQAIKTFQDKFTKKLQWGVLILLIALGILNFNMAKATFFVRMFGDAPMNPYFNEEKQSLVELIPEGDGVAATFGFLSNLSTREHLFSFHKIFDHNYQKRDNPFILPQTVTHVLVDFDDVWIKGMLGKNESFFYFTSEKLQNFILYSSWFVKESVDNVVLFEKNSRSRRRLIEVLDQLDPLDADLLVKAVNNELAIKDIQLKGRKALEGKLLSFDIYWRSTNEVLHKYLMVFIVRKDDRSIIIKKNPGYRFYPPKIWPQGKVIKEYYAFPLPEWGEGQYSITVGLLDGSDVKALGVNMNDELSLIKKMKTKRTFTFEG